MQFLYVHEHLCGGGWSGLGRSVDVEPESEIALVKSDLEVPASWPPYLDIPRFEDLSITDSDYELKKCVVSDLEATFTTWSEEYESLIWQIWNLLAGENASVQKYVLSSFIALEIKYVTLHYVCEIGNVLEAFSF